VYTGKAFYGMMDQIHKKNITSSHNILFIHTGGTFSLLNNQHQYLTNTNSNTGQNITHLLLNDTTLLRHKEEYVTENSQPLVSILTIKNWK